jgi:hypothetical protein
MLYGVRLDLQGLYNTKLIQIYTKIDGLVMFRPVILNRFCTKTSNIGIKIDKIVEMRFLCVCKLLSHKCWPRDVELTDNVMT